MPEDRLSGPFLHQILSFIDPPDVFRCMRVSRGFYETIKRNADQLSRYRAQLGVERRTVEGSKNKFQLSIRCLILAYKERPAREIDVVFDVKTMLIYGSQRELFSEACKYCLDISCLMKLSSQFSSRFLRCRNSVLSIVGKRRIIETCNTFAINGQLASFRRILAVVLGSPLLDFGVIKLADCNSFADENSESDFLAVIRDLAACSRRLDPKVLRFDVPKNMCNLCMEVLAAFDNRKLLSYDFEINSLQSALESVRSIMLRNKWLVLLVRTATFDRIDIVKELLKEWQRGTLNVYGFCIYGRVNDCAEPFVQFIRELPLIAITDNGDNRHVKGSFGRSIDDDRLGFEIDGTNWTLYGTAVPKAFEEAMIAVLMKYTKD